MRTVLQSAAVVATLLTAAIFGFFYAWAVSVMWGLDGAPPEVAVAAMQAVNAAVRNAAFAPAFFGAPLALGVVAALALAGRRSPRRPPSTSSAASA